MMPRKGNACLRGECPPAVIDPQPYARRTHSQRSPAVVIRMVPSAVAIRMVLAILAIRMVLQDAVMRMVPQAETLYLQVSYP